MVLFGWPPNVDCVAGVEIDIDPPPLRFATLPPMYNGQIVFGDGLYGRLFGHDDSGSSTDASSLLSWTHSDITMRLRIVLDKNNQKQLHPRLSRVCIFLSSFQLVSHHILTCVF